MISFYNICAWLLWYGWGYNLGRSNINCRSVMGYKLRSHAPSRSLEHYFVLCYITLLCVLTLNFGTGVNCVLRNCPTWTQLLGAQGWACMACYRRQWQTYSHYRGKTALLRISPIIVYVLGCDGVEKKAAMCQEVRWRFRFFELKKIAKNQLLLFL